MKLLLLSDLNSIHTKRWTQSLSAAGLELCVFGIEACTDNFYQTLPNVTTGSSSGKARKRGTFSKLFYLSSLRNLREVYREFKPDIVHAHYASSYGLLGSVLKHRPYFISVWGSDVYDFPQKNWFNRKLLIRNLNRADVICSTGETMALETQKYTEKKIHVIPFGVDTGLFKPSADLNNQTNAPFTFGIVKSLERHYGIDLLIRAFAVLAHRFPTKALRLIIAGDGSLFTELKKLAVDIGVAEHVNFTGRVAHQLLPACLNQMDVVVVPSERESFGVAAIEASACEKPVIVSNVGGLPEVVLDGETGIVLENRTAELLAKKMEFLMLNPESSNKMGKKGRQNVMAKYEWSNNVSEMIRLYERSLGLSAANG